MKFNKIPEALLDLAAEGAALQPIAMMLNKERKQNLRAITCESIYEFDKEHHVEAEFDIVLKESDVVKTVGVTLQGLWYPKENHLMFLESGEAKTLCLNYKEPYFHHYVVYVYNNDIPVKSTFFSNMDEAGCAFHEECQDLYKAIEGTNTDEEYSVLLVKQDADSSEEIAEILRTEYKDGHFNNVLPNK